MPGFKHDNHVALCHKSAYLPIVTDHNIWQLALYK